MKPFPKILLASKSPRRHQILSEAGFAFEVVSIDADESFDPALTKEAVCMYLAKHKAAHYLEKTGPNVLVTADTIVCIDDEIINKPADADEAFGMLKKLNGRMHEVFTGVCIKTDENEHVFYQKTEVYFHTLTDEELYFYIEKYQPFDKAGAYGVQDWMGYIGVRKINGCFYNVMGFPMAAFYRELQQFLTH